MSALLGTSPISSMNAVGLAVTDSVAGTGFFNDKAISLRPRCNANSRSAIRSQSLLLLAHAENAMRPSPGTKRRGNCTIVRPLLGLHAGGPSSVTRLRHTHSPWKTPGGITPRRKSYSCPPADRPVPFCRTAH